MMIIMELLEYGLFMAMGWIFYCAVRKLWKWTDVKEKIEAIKDTEVQYEHIERFTEEHDLNNLREKRETIDAFKHE